MCMIIVPDIYIYRNNTDTRRWLNEIIGFEEVEKFRLPKELKNRLITNPRPTWGQPCN